MASATAAPDLNTIVNRMEEAQLENHRRMVAYTVTRQYELFAGTKPKATVIADVSFRPPTTKQWSIRKVTGSGRGEGIVKKLLQREARYANDGKIAMSRRDYHFQYLGRAKFDGKPCYLLALIPKSNDDDLLNGKLWVDAASFHLRHFEGQPAKSPSWWIKELKLTMDYGEVNGMWLPVFSKGVAEVRLFGQHTMLERNLHFRSAHAVARSPSRRRPRAPSPAAAVGASILLER